MRLNDFRDSYTRVQLEWEINLIQGTVHLPRDETKPGAKGMSVPSKIKRLENKSKMRNWRKCETPNLHLFLPSAHSHLFTPHQSVLKQPQWHMDTCCGCHRGSLQWPHSPLTRLHQSLTPHLTDSTHHWPDSTNHWHLTSLTPPTIDQTPPITDTSPHSIHSSLTRLNQSLTHHLTGSSHHWPDLTNHCASLQFKLSSDQCINLLIYFLFTPESESCLM